MNELSFEQLPWVEEELSMPETLTIEEAIDDKSAGVVTQWGDKPPHTPTVSRFVDLTANYVIQFEGAVHAAAGNYGKGYEIGFTIARHPGFTQLPNRHQSTLKPNDSLSFAIWCSHATRGWYSQRFRKEFGGGNQTPWINLGVDGKNEIGGAVVWVPGEGYNSKTMTVVHSLMLRRVSSGLEEIFIWRPGSGAPFPYTNNQALKPANPSEDQMSNGLRRVFRISPNNSTGLELWGRPLYRMPL
jgi:hypothetical protein